jgi:hypothetical protein
MLTAPIPAAATQVVLQHHPAQESCTRRDDEAYLFPVLGRGYRGGTDVTTHRVDQTAHGTESSTEHVVGAGSLGFVREGCFR